MKDQTRFGLDKTTLAKVHFLVQTIKTGEYGSNFEEICVDLSQKGEKSAFYGKLEELSSDQMSELWLTSLNKTLSALKV